MAGRGRSGTRAARGPDGPFVGRDDLLEELAVAAADAERGAGAVVLLTGEAGIGKTSVARALARQVRDQLAVSWGSCSVDRSAPPFWPWRDLLPGDPPAPPEGETGADRAIGAERHEALRALRDHVVERASLEPRLHVLEDLQWADVASALLLVHLGAAIVDTPLLVVATVRTGESLARPMQETFEEVRRIGRVRPLSPLGDDDVAALLRDAELGADAEQVALVRARTGGNPLLVSELLRSVQASGTHDAAAALRRGVPERVSELVAHRLTRLPQPVAEVLRTASVVGPEGDARTVAGARGTDVAPVVDLLEQARAAHLLDPAPPGRWLFRHQLIRDAVYDGIAGSERARHHAAVLEALSGDPSTPPPVLAHHALAAQPLFDADRAVALAARAGESAFAHHAYEEAIAWFDRALAAAPAATSPRWRSELLVLAGEAHRHIGEIDEARQAFAAAADLTEDPALLARAALGYADPGADLGIAYRADDLAIGERLERALDAQPEADSVTVVLLEARLAAELYFSDEPGRARTLADAALERAHRLGDPRALGAAAAVAHDAFVVGQRDIEEQLRGSEQLLEWARADGSSAARLTAHRARVLDLLASGDVATMDTEIVAFSRLAEPLGAPGYLWWPALWAAMRALSEGRHEEAEARASAAFEIGAGPFPTLAFVNLSFLLFFLRREQGRLDEMEQSLRDAVASRADIPAMRVALTFLLAELGRLEEARVMLAGFDAAALERVRDRNWPASWFQLARAAHLVGDRALAATLVEDRYRPTERCVQVSLATVCLGATDLGVAWLLHTTGDLDAAAVRYEAAEDTCARIAARSWLAQAQADHARLLLERDGTGDRAAARRRAALATTAADEIGLASVRPALDEVRQRLDGPGAEGAGAPARVTPPAATFRRDGAVWEVAFAGRTARLPHARGLSDLAHLLARPGEAVSVLELAEADGTGPSRARGAEALDERARREIRARLHELDAEEADAEAAGDGERAALARERRQELAEAVARDLGLGGRARRIGDPVERARKTVSTRIRRAVAAVGQVHPELGRHLERSVDTGAWCAYRPAEPVRWTT